jgi:hypothetical protein
MGAKSVSVYRKFQPQWWSPCVLGDPCEVCKAHLRGKKRNTECLRATPATPAFSVPIKTAIALVKDGLAGFIHRNTAIQLTFAKIAHLRDRSLRIDENFLMAYAAGRKWARDLFENAWDGKAQAQRVEWTAAQTAESRKATRSFT